MKITDTLDTTTLTLNDVTVDEGTGTATITGSLDHAPETTLVVTLNNGATMTFEPSYVPGTLIPSTSFLINNGEDVYKDGSNFQLSVAGTTGGNFEKLDTSDTATVTVKDTVDTTTLTLNDAIVDEGTGTATITGSLNYAPETTLVVTLDNGATITFEPSYVPGTPVTSTGFPINNGEDVYKDGSNFQLSVAGTTGGNFEKLDISDTATVTVEDTTDTTSISLTAGPNLTEAGGDLVYTVTLGHEVRAGDAPVTVTFTDLNGVSQSIIINSGTTGTVTVTIPPTLYEDKYAEAPVDLPVAKDVVVSGGGDFEALGAPSVGTVKITDTIDPVYATIEVDKSAVMEGGELIYTVKLVDSKGVPVTVADGKNVTVELNWSGVAGATDVNSLPSSVTIDAGKSAADPFTVTTKVDTNSELSESLTASINGVIDNAGVDKGFESLQVSPDKNSVTSNILDAPTIKAVDNNGSGAANGQITVYEKGLSPSGSDAASDLETAPGILQVTAVTGLESISINGTSITFAELEGLAGNPKIITIPGHGTLTLTSFEPTTQVNGKDAVWDIEYSYKLTDKQTHSGGNNGANEALNNITLGVVAKDAAGTGTVSGAGNLGVQVIDDVPKVDVIGTGSDVQVDETYMGTEGSADFSGAFKTVFGADGKKSFVYTFDFVDGGASGLIDTASGKAITLHDNGTGVVEGRVDGSTALSDKAFTITVDANGKVTLTQSRAVKHPTTTDHNEPITLKDSDLKLKATATDGDDDQGHASINIGDRFSFKDDGPAINSAPLGGIVDEAHLALGSEAIKDPTKIQVTNSLNVKFGKDGAGDVQFTQATKTALEAMGLKAGTTALVYVVAPDGHTLIAYRGIGRNEADKIFTVEITDPTGNPGYKFTLNGALTHLNEFGNQVSGLTLPFDGIRVTDGDGDSVETDFKIVVMDDTPDNAQSKQVPVDEDSQGDNPNNTFNTNADAIGPDPDNGITGNTSIGDGSHGTVAPAHGTATVNPDGTITYVPNGNYSGKDTFTYTTMTDSETKTFTVEVTVKPKADAPNLGANKIIGTPEDVNIGLGLEKPIITDNVDKNGSTFTGDDSTLGDNPERIGGITLTLDNAAPAGTALTLANGTALTAVSGVYTIVIVKTEGKTDVDTKLHINPDSPGFLTAGINYLTEAQYKAIQTKLAEHSHKNFNVTVGATSYEVDDNGTPLSGIQGAPNSQTITVAVQAVTDNVVLNFNTAITNGDSTATVDGAPVNETYTVTYTGTKAATVALNEDSSFNLKTLLSANFEDLDGSEVRSITIENTTGHPIIINGVELAAGGKVTINAPDLSGSTTGFPNISIGPKDDYSGSLNGIKVTLNAQDKDADGYLGSDGNMTEVNVDGVEEADKADNTVTLNLDVKPRAGDVVAADVSTVEDTAVAFLTGVKVTDIDGNGTEVINSVEFELPADWIMVSPANSGGWTLAGDGSATSPYKITFDNTLGETGREAVLKGFMVTPPAHSSKDATVTVKVTTTDTNGANSDTVDTNLNIKITVTPVAEKIKDKGASDDVDTDGNKIPDLTINPDYEYAKEGFEDQWFELGTDYKAGTLFKLENGWKNEDSNEETYARLTPELIPGDGQAGMNANGSIFRYSTNNITSDEGGVWVEQVFVGTPIDIPLEYLHTLQFKAKEDFAGKFKIKVQAYTLDYDDDFPGDKSKAKTNTSGEATLSNVLIKPVADQASVSLNARATGLEDKPIDLAIHPRSSDPSEVFTVKIDKIPAGAVLIYDSEVLPLTDNGDGTFSVEIPNFKSTKTLTVQPPADSNDTFALEVQAKTVDTLTVGEETHTSSGSWSPPLTIQVDVKGVADAAEVTPQNVTYIENQLDNDGKQIKLNELVSIKLALGEQREADDAAGNGSETLTVRITGLPEGFVLQGGGKLLDGTATGVAREWLLTEDELANVTIKAPTNFSGTQTFQVRGVTTENDGSSHTGAPVTVTIKVKASVDADINSSTTLVEDEWKNLDFSLTHPTGDADETLTGLWIKVGSGTGTDKFTLHLGADSGSAVALADAGLSTDTFDGDTWYQLTPEQAKQLWAKGDGNLDGDLGGFEFRYEVTDSHFGSTGVGADLSTTEIKQGTYQITATPVTDPVVLTIKDISGVSSGTTATDSDATDNHAKDTATLSGQDQVTVTLNVAKQPDADAGSKSDHDGSEQIIRVLIDDVPQGVSVVDAEQTGDGSWLLVYEGSNALPITLNGHDLNVRFDVGKYTGRLTDHPVKITVQTQDRGDEAAPDTDIKSGEVTWKLTTEFTGETLQTPEIVEWKYNGDSANEDGSFTLDTKFTADVTPVAGVTNGYTVTLKNLPLDTLVEGIKGVTVTKTMLENGDEIWTASTTGPLQKLLEGIQVTPPPNWNDNHAGVPGDPNNPYNPFTVDATLSAYVVGGGSISQTITPVIPVIPVTDAADITLTVDNVAEGSASIPLTVQVDLVDSPYGQIVGGKLYIKANIDGVLQDANGNPLTKEGDWYVLENVQQGQSVSLNYIPTDPLVNGKVTFEAKVESTETNASNTEPVPANTSKEIDVYLIHDGVNVTQGEFSGSETADSHKDSAIQLKDLAVALKDNDNSESIKTILLSGVPEGFLVYVGADAASAGLADMANNAGLVNGTNTWELPVMNGGIPPYVAILPPKHWSGQVTGLGLTVESGEKSLPDTLTETFVLPTLTVKPVANGLTLSVSNSFGTEGEKIPLNLNAAMLDPVAVNAGTASAPLLDASTETTTLVLTGMGEHAAFYGGADGNTLLNLTPDKVKYSATEDTYTLTGLTQTDLDNLSFVQAKDAIGTVTVKGQTVDGDSTSAWTGVTNVPLSITAVRATTGDDIFLYDGGLGASNGVIDGGVGTDTIQLRFGEDLTGTELAAKLKNIEILDLSVAGKNEITSLTVQDVLDMTDDRNTLRINGDGEDKVTLNEQVWGTGIAGSGSSNGYTVYTATIDSQIVKLEVQSIID